MLSHDATSKEIYKPESASNQSGGGSNFIINIAKQLKSLDGVDEVAQALGQILPGVAGPIATASVLACATPFVYLGLLGMKEEYTEACREYNEILKSKKDSDLKLQEMAENAGKWRAFLSKKLHLGIEDTSKEEVGHLGFLELDSAGLKKFSYQIVKSEFLRNEEFVARLAKKYGWTGIGGMGGMFVGMLPAIASAGIQIFKELGITSQAALDISAMLTTISSSSFLAGQIAMSVYAGNKMRQGMAEEKVLNSNRAQLIKHVLGKIKPSTGKALLGDIDSRIRLNRKCNIHYGSATIVGQALMSAGTITSLCGASPIIGIPLVAAGAPITVGAAISRIFYKHKEDHFKGKKTDYAEKHMSRTELLPMLLEDNANKNVNQTLESEFESSSRKLAYTKLYSFMRHLNNDNKYISYSAEDKMRRLKKIVASGNISIFQRTSLRGDVLNTVKEIFNSENENIKDFFRLPKDQANKLLLANVVNCAQDESGNVPKFDNAIDLNFSSLNELLVLLGEEGKIDSAKASECGVESLNKLIITKLKNSTKFVRHDVADKFAYIAHINELRNVIAAENSLQNISLCKDQDISVAKKREHTEELILPQRTHLSSYMKTSPQELSGIPIYR